MRAFQLAFVYVVLCGVVGCSIAPKPDSAVVTSSPLPSMQKYNDCVGKDYWVGGYVVQLCQGPTGAHCLEFLKSGTHLKVDGLIPNHSEAAGTSIDQPYFHVLVDDGRAGFVDAVLLAAAATTTDPAVAATQCKEKGGPTLGMTAAQVVASCWGKPQYVNTKIRRTGKYEQYVYDDNKFVHLHNGIVTSVTLKGRSSGTR